MSHSSGVHVWLALWKATSAMEVHVAQSGSQLQMCRSDFAILEALLQQGPLPVNTLGREVLLTSGSVTTAVTRLEARQLVQRTWQQDDRRVCLVELTDQGRALIENAADDHSAMMEAACSGLTTAERKILLGLLKKLGAQSEKESAPAAKKPVERKEKATSPDDLLPKNDTDDPVSEPGFAGFTDLD